MIAEFMGGPWDGETVDVPDCTDTYWVPLKPEPVRAFGPLVPLPLSPAIRKGAYRYGGGNVFLWMGEE